MTTTLTMNERLEELGTLEGNEDKTIQRAGAEMIEAFFNTHNEGENPDNPTIAQMLFYLTDTQVRDYALGLLDPDKSVELISALNFLVDHAPANTKYMNAPASLAAALHYELGNTEDAFLALSNAQDDYSLAQLLYRVFRAGWAPASFAKMRADLHPLVTVGIFGGNK